MLWIFVLIFFRFFSFLPIFPMLLKICVVIIYWMCICLHIHTMMHHVACQSKKIFKTTFSSGIQRFINNNWIQLNLNNRLCLQYEGGKFPKHLKNVLSEYVNICSILYCNMEEVCWERYGLMWLISVEMFVIEGNKRGTIWTWHEKDGRSSAHSPSYDVALFYLV